MADKTQVANLALQKLGEDDQLTNVDTDDGTSPRAIRAAFDICRRATLRKGKFNFSLVTVELTAGNPDAIPAPPSAFPYENRFPLPAGCLRVVEVLDAAGKLVTDYRVRGGAIVTNAESPIYLEHVVDVPEAGLWDDLFVEAFASRLAFQVADRVTGDRGRKADCWQQFLAAMKAAAGVDAKEDPPTETPDSEWIEARF